MRLNLSVEYTASVTKKIKKSVLFESPNWIEKKGVCLLKHTTVHTFDNSSVQLNDVEREKKNTNHAFIRISVNLSNSKYIHIVNSIEVTLHHERVSTCRVTNAFGPTKPRNWRMVRQN